MSFIAGAGAPEDLVFCADGSPLLGAPVRLSPCTEAELLAT